MVPGYSVAGREGRLHALTRRSGAKGAAGTPAAVRRRHGGRLGVSAQGHRTGLVRGAAGTYSFSVPPEVVMRRTPFLAVPIALLLLASGAAADIPLGATAPDFTKSVLGGGFLSLSQYTPGHGKVVVIFLLGYS